MPISPSSSRSQSPSSLVAAETLLQLSLSKPPILLRALDQESNQASSSLRKYRWSKEETTRLTNLLKESLQKANPPTYKAIAEEFRTEHTRHTLAGVMKKIKKLKKEFNCQHTPVIGENAPDSTFEDVVIEGDLRLSEKESQSLLEEVRVLLSSAGGDVIDFKLKPVKKLSSAHKSTPVTWSPKKTTD